MVIVKDATRRKRTRCRYCEYFFKKRLKAELQNITTLRRVPRRGDSAGMKVSGSTLPTQSSRDGNSAKRSECLLTVECDSMTLRPMALVTDVVVMGRELQRFL